MALKFPRGRPTGPVIEIGLCAGDLPKMDLVSQSDPFVVLFVHCARWQLDDIPNPTNRCMFRDIPQGTGPAEWFYFGETEIIWDNHYPQFSTRMFLPDKEGETWNDVLLRFEVYDADTKDNSDPLTAHDFIGGWTTSMAELLQKRCAMGELSRHAKLGGLRSAGRLLVSTERYNLPLSQRPLTIQAKFEKDVCLPEDTRLFYHLVRQASVALDESTGKHLVSIYRSGAVVTDPERILPEGLCFQEASLDGELCLHAGDDCRSLIIELYRYAKDGNHELLGRSDRFSLAAVKRGDRNGQYPIYYSHESRNLVAGKVEVSFAYILDRAVDVNESGSSVGGADLNPSIPNSLIFRFSDLQWTNYKPNTVRKVVRKVVGSISSRTQGRG